MMHDSLHPSPAAREQAPEASQVQAAPFLSDREVTPPGTEMSAAMHAYLDGDAVNGQALHASARELGLWKRIGDETGRRRLMVTPSHISAQILAKLADD